MIRSQSPIFRQAVSILLLLSCTTTVLSQSTVDRIRRRTGVDSGQITDMSVLAVTISKSGVESKVPVEEIRTVYFAGEPAELSTARSALSRGRWADARTALSKIDRDHLSRPELVQEVEYLDLECQARLALSGEGDLGAAIGLANDFLARNRSSYHVSSAIELLGDLYLANDQEDEARSQYAKLAKAPAPYFQARSALLLGRLLQKTGQHKEAIAEFDRALAAAKGNPAAQPIELEATLDRAISRSATGEVAEATGVVKEIITQAQPDDIRLMATAYNALGDCYLQSGKKKAARDAFLHVDVLFSAAADQHAKALYELSRLWNELDQPQRAQEAKQRLQDQYPASRWAKL
jgi:tetratricopeptide (TPR) repeat protein